MSDRRFKLIAEVYVLFRRGDEFLLSLRASTGYCDGQYGLVSGHVDGGEPLAVAAAREALEEAGVRIDPRDLTLRTVMHRNTDSERIGFFFEPSRWQGDPVNAEPHKCGGLAWYAPEMFPANTIPYVRQAIANVLADVAYAADWGND